MFAGSPTIPPTTSASAAEPENRFFVDEYSPVIRGPMASFRRHKTEENLRKEWQKKREPFVKFYKHELKRVRKQSEKDRIIEEGQAKDNKETKKDQQKQEDDKGN